MKRASICLGLVLLFGSCQTNNALDQVVSQTFVHKYGFETSEEEWEAREQDGQVVTLLKNGVKVIRTYEDGKLHGQTSYSFPHSALLEKIFVYDQGSLLKERVNDSAGMPVREEVYEFDNRTIITLWDEKGVPLSIEEYEDGILSEGKFYTPGHELEAVITNGNGERIKRSRSGELISRDDIQSGQMICRTTFHPNGRIHTVSHYQNYQLHGLQSKFTSTGKPLMELNWDHGVLEGEKVVYRNGYKIAEIPYVMGEKHGSEIHYDDLGNLTVEIEWKNNKKHGPSKIHTEGYTDTEWFYKGQSVNLDKFRILENRDRVIKDFRENEIR